MKLTWITQVSVFVFVHSCYTNLIFRYRVRTTGRDIGNENLRRNLYISHGTRRELDHAWSCWLSVDRHSRYQVGWNVNETLGKNNKLILYNYVPCIFLLCLLRSVLYENTDGQTVHGKWRPVWVFPCLIKLSLRVKTDEHWSHLYIL